MNEFRPELTPNDRKEARMPPGAGFPASTSMPGGVCCSTSTFATNCPAAERRPGVSQAILD